MAEYLLTTVSKLLDVLEKKNYHQKVCGSAYNKDFLAFVLVDELGVRMTPNYITKTFARVVRKHDFKRIRFHDLRHSCASLLLANGVSLKEIQDWLGHSDFDTTANIYAHLDYDSKLSSASTLSTLLEGTKHN